MASVHIVNERDTVLDLTGVQDATGAAFSLKPKGQLGSSRECDASVLKHPMVKKLIDDGWISTASSAPDETPPVPMPLPPHKDAVAVQPGTLPYPTHSAVAPPVSEAVLPYTENAPPYVAPSNVTEEQAEAAAQATKPEDTLEREKDQPGYTEEIVKGDPPPPMPPIQPNDPRMADPKFAAAALAQAEARGAEQHDETKTDETKSDEHKDEKSHKSSKKR